MRPAILRRKGVAIILAKDLPFTITHTLAYTEGRYLFLKGYLGDKPLTLANIYTPNSGQVTFMHRICQHLSGFGQGLIMLGGDLYVTLIP